MKEEILFTAALGIRTPWVIEEISFKEGEGKGELHIWIKCESGSKFEYEGDHYSMYDHQDRTWRHLDFFQHVCYLHCKVPRIQTKAGKTLLVEVPWASESSKFTLLFEDKVLELLNLGMSNSAVGRHFGIDGKTIFRIAKRRVVVALAEEQLDEVKRIGLDETSYQKGHKYLTILTDRELKKVVGIGIGRTKDSVNEALMEMEIRGSERELIKEISMDMSKSYISAHQEYIPNSSIVFDRFHLVYNLNRKIDEIRKREQKEFKELKGTKYIWLKNGKNLSETQKEIITALEGQYLQTGKAYQLKEQFREVMDNAVNDKKLKWLNGWMKQAWESGIEEMQEYVKLLSDHWYGIKTYFNKMANNGFAERVNLTIQEIKRIAYGYRNIENYKIMIYLRLGKLNLTTHYK